MATVGMSPSEDGPPSSSGAEASYAHPPALRQCDPPTFSGIELEDVDDWRERIERTGRFKRRDAETQLNNVIFSLSGVAWTWSINHEADFEDWTAFPTRFRILFGRPASRVSEAQQKLSFRVD